MGKNIPFLKGVDYNQTAQNVQSGYYLHFSKKVPDLKG